MSEPSGGEPLSAPVSPPTRPAPAAVAADTAWLLPRWLRRAGAPLLLLVGALVLGGCNYSSLPTFGAFHGATVQARDEFKLWFWTAVAGLVVAAIVWGLIFWAIVAYRRRRGDDRIPRQFHTNRNLEIVYTTIPILIVAALFYFTVVTENEIDALPKPAEVVHVLAYRWGWRFSYASSSGQSQGVTIQTAAQPNYLPKPATSKQYPQMVLPEGERTEIVLKSNDVVHGFYVPAFNFNRYAQPGITNHFDFTPIETGVFPAQCNAYCGLYHAEMLFSVRVVPPAQFTKWLSSQQVAQS